MAFKMKLAIWSYEAPAHVGVSKAAASFAKVHCVLRAPKGDGYGTIMLAMFERLGVVAPLSVCAMSEATLAGASADLPVLLREVDARHKPETIVVTRSATASVLQEPLEGEVSVMRPGELNAEIFFASAHPVRDTETSAFALTTRELVAHFAQDAPRSAGPSVNIIGPSLLGFHDHSNVASLRRDLAKLGIEVNAVVPLGASPEDIRGIGRAWVNVPLGHELAQPTLDYLKERFGTPYVDELPFGEAGTTRFLRRLCALCEIPAERIAEAAQEAKLSWYSRTVDAHALSSKRVAVFGTPTTAAGIARVLHDELDMQVEFVGTYVLDWAGWLRARVADITSNVLITDDYREVARAIDETRPDIMFGSQMERHSASALGLPCAVISPPAHILNFPLGYAPFAGYDGANHIGDLVNQTQVLGLEHHLIEMFGPRGQGRFAEAAPEPERRTPPETLPVPAAAQLLDLTAPKAGDAPLHWDRSAEKLLGRVPFFVRKKARELVEKYARDHDIVAIDESVVVRAREHAGK
ncbi:MAG: ferredoxin:protochlorophyllide reductase (ATP-dependent) subunit B [Candidatus Baltobacteraceae bacterium]